MDNNDKLFKAGEIILESKTYGAGWSFVISNSIGGLIAKFFLPNIWYFFVPVILITTIGGLMLYILVIRKKLFPNSEYGMRYQSITLFDEYLVGRLEFDSELFDDKIEFKDIKDINQKGKNEIIITFNEEFKPSSSDLKLIDNRIQDYEINNKLSKLQKKELVNYLNERIKSENNQ